MIKNPTAIAIYSEDDSSLTFYCVDGGKIPEVGSYYKNKIVTEIYTGMDTNTYSSETAVPWYSYRSSILSTMFDSTFRTVQPVSTAYWFCYFTHCVNINLQNLDTSKVTNMGWMFMSCVSIQEFDVTKLKTDNVTSMQGMFYGIRATEIDVSTFNTSKVTDMLSMFYTCSNLTTIYSDDNNFVVTSIENPTAQLFFQSSKLVGGNGTKYDSSKTDASMAHVDTENNPGYFTQK